MGWVNSNDRTTVDLKEQILTRIRWIRTNLSRRNEVLRRRKIETKLSKSISFRLND